LSFDGAPFSKAETESFARTFYSKVEGGFELLLGMFGIGKTALIISNNGK
jgi:DNA replication protein DnaC